MSKSCSHWCHSAIWQLPPSSCAFITVEECNESILGICRPPRCICCISCHFLHGLKKHKFHSSCFLVQYVSERTAIEPTAWNTSSCACCGHSVAWLCLHCCCHGTFIERIWLLRLDRRAASAAARSCCIYVCCLSLSFLSPSLSPFCISMVSSWAQTQTSAVIIICLRRCSTARIFFVPFQFFFCYLVNFGARWLNLSITLHTWVIAFSISIFIIFIILPVLWYFYIGLNSNANTLTKIWPSALPFFLSVWQQRSFLIFFFFFAIKFISVHCFILQTPSVHKSTLLFSIKWKQNWLSPHPLQSAWTLCVYYIVLMLLESTPCPCTLINLLSLLNAGLIVSEAREQLTEEQTSPSLRDAIPAD